MNIVRKVSSHDHILVRKSRDISGNIADGRRHEVNPHDLERYVLAFQFVFRIHRLEVILPVLGRRERIVYAQTPSLKVTGLAANHAVFDIDGNDDLIILEFTCDIRFFRHPELVAAWSGISVRDIADIQTVGIDLFFREIRASLDPEIVPVCHGEHILSIRPFRGLDPLSVRVIFRHGQPVSVHRDVQRVGVDGVQFVVVRVARIRDKSAVVSGGEDSCLVDGAVALCAEAAGTAVVEEVASAGPVRYEGKTVRRFLVRSDDQVVFRIDARLCRINPLQREDAVCRGPSDRLFGILERNIFCLNQFDGDIGFGIVSDNNDCISLVSGVVKRNGEACLLVHVQSMVFHAVSGERAQIVSDLHFLVFDRIAEIREGQVRARIDEVFRAVFRKLSCRIEELSPVCLSDNGAVIVQVCSGTVAVEAHRIA